MSSVRSPQTRFRTCQRSEPICPCGRSPRGTVELVVGGEAVSALRVGLCAAVDERVFGRAIREVAEVDVRVGAGFDVVAIDVVPVNRREARLHV